MNSHCVAQSELVAEFKEARMLAEVYKDYSKLVTFTNTRLAKAWKDDSGEKLEVNELMDRVENYGAEVPDGVLFVTAGCDTQDDRLEYSIVGWGLGAEAWILEHGIVWRDTVDTEVWKQLEQKVYKRRLHYKEAAASKWNG